MNNVRILQKTWDRLLIKAWERNWKTKYILSIFNKKILGNPAKHYTQIRDELHALGVKRLPPDTFIFMNPGVFFASFCPGFVEAYLDRENKDDHYIDLDSLPWRPYEFTARPSKSNEWFMTSVRQKSRRTALQASMKLVLKTALKHRQSSFGHVKGG